MKFNVDRIAIRQLPPGGRDCCRAGINGHQFAGGSQPPQRFHATGEIDTADLHDYLPRKRRGRRNCCGFEANCYRTAGRGRFGIPRPLPGSAAHCQSHPQRRQEPGGPFPAAFHRAGDRWGAFLGRRGAVLRDHRQPPPGQTANAGSRNRLWHNRA